MFLKSRTWINVDFKRNFNLCCEFHSPRVRGRVKGCCQTEVAMSSLSERQRTSKIKYVPALLKHRTFKGLKKKTKKPLNIVLCGVLKRESMTVK